LTDHIGESRRVAHAKRNRWIYLCLLEQAPDGGLATRRGHQERLMPDIRALSSGCSIILKASEEMPAGAVQLVHAFHDAWISSTGVRLS
jgi:hypothetical protein